jgi:L(+)-tartrate dehydratase alpha subunit
MDRQEAARSLTDLMARFTRFIGRRLPQDVLEKLAELRAREAKPLAKVVYDPMLENLEAADEFNHPCCQDTGVVQFFVRAGAQFPLLGELKDILGQAVRQATRDAPLRHNAVETYAEQNTSDNTGRGVPWIEWEVVPDDDTCTIEVYMAGGGCTLPGAAKVLMPAAGYEGVVQFVLDVITSYGVNACPPLLVGIGVSTSVETASMLSRRAILRPIGTRHPDPRVAEMELAIEKGLNDIGIGAQGRTGSSAVMGVHVESSARHPSTMGVGVSVGCWAHRRGAIRVNPDLSYEIPSHKGVTL